MAESTLPPTADTLGQLQKRLLELSELMYNGLGLIQRNAVPVTLRDAQDATLAVPLSVPVGEQDQWRAAAEQQHQVGPLSLPLCAMCMVG